MTSEELVYEQRQTTLCRGGLEEYVQQTRDRVWPYLNGQGAEVLCFVNGLIGLPAEEIIQITRFPDVATWQRCQSQGDLTGGGLVEKEEVRLLRSVASRPKQHIPPEDKRAVYGYHRFFIRAGDLAEFGHCSEDGIWPRIEAQDARILGLWVTLAATDPLEVVLMTGYHGPAHWEETRVTRAMPPNFDPELWDRDIKLRARRRQITIKSWVCLMQSIEVAPFG